RCTSPVSEERSWLGSGTTSPSGEPPAVWPNGSGHARNGGGHLARRLGGPVVRMVGAPGSDPGGRHADPAARSGGHRGLPGSRWLVVRSWFGDPRGGHPLLLDTGRPIRSRCPSTGRPAPGGTRLVGPGGPEPS